MTFPALSGQILEPLSLEDFCIDDFQKYAGHVELSSKLVFNEIQFEIGNCEDEGSIRFRIKHYQQKLIELSNTLLQRSIPNQKINSTGTRLLDQYIKTIIPLLETMIDELWDRYPSFFDQDANISNSRLLEFKNVLPGKIQELTKRLRTPETERIINISLEPFEEIIQHKTKELSFGKMWYLTKLLDELSEVKDNDDVNCAIRTLLANADFNSRHMMEYMQENIQTEIDEYDSISDKLERLTFFLKTIRQLPLKLNSRLNPNEISLVEYCISYVNQEFGYQQYLLEKQQSTVMTVQGNGISKLQMSLSVSAIAALLKAMCGAGLVCNRNHSEILRIASTTLCTEKKEDLSFDSLRTKFYHIDNQTKEAIIDVCRKLLLAARSLN